MGINRQFAGLAGVGALASRLRTDGSRWRALVAVALALVLPARTAFADLLLYPTRVVFERNMRSAQVELINNGSETTSYRISFVHLRMTPQGGLDQVKGEPQAGEGYVDNLVRYSPRQVTLEPGKSQVVRLMLRKPANLPAGEYRSHLQFDRLPPPAGKSSIEPNKPEGIGIQLTALIGASIPVIVRHGDTQATVKVSGVRLEPGKAGQPPRVKLKLEREGNRSVYGDVRVYFVPRSGPERLLARIDGIAVYTPLQSREAIVGLDRADMLKLVNGKLRVTYSDRAEEGGKLLSEAFVNLP